MIEITVGTQVRLTGVVWLVDSSGVWVDFPGADHPQRVKAPFDAIEVIRQPFKRGEVVWFTGPLLSIGGDDGDDGSRVVVTDEADGKVLIVAPQDESIAYLSPAEDYERRP